jgi:hypothetical protein
MCFACIQTPPLNRKGTISTIAGAQMEPTQSTLSPAMSQHIHAKNIDELTTIGHKLSSNMSRIGRHAIFRVDNPPSPFTPSTSQCLFSSEDLHTGVERIYAKRPIITRHMYNFRHTETMRINAKYGLEIPKVTNTAKWFKISKLMISVTFKISLGTIRLKTHS